MRSLWSIRFCLTRRSVETAIERFWIWKQRDWKMKDKRISMLLQWKLSYRFFKILFDKKTLRWKNATFDKKCQNSVIFFEKLHFKKKCQKWHESITCGNPALNVKITQSQTTFILETLKSSVYQTLRGNQTGRGNEL